MEFPMMANNGVSDKDYENTDVTFHELAHSYFPFLMGINEVKYSWMEEGWATFFTIKFIQEYYKNTPKKDTELNRILNRYNKSAGNMWDVPIITPSYLLTLSSAHSQLSYFKPGFMYATLEHLLGEEVFKICLKTYMERWERKHPTPYDFMYSFNDVSNINLNWFWNKWIFGNGYGDLGIVKVENSKVYIQNFGGLPLPIFLKLTYKNGKQVYIEKTASIWNHNDHNFVPINILDAENLLEIKLIDDNYPDTNKKNNLLKM
jgi:aminopeptidase N